MFCLSLHHLCLFICVILASLLIVIARLTFCLTPPWLSQLSKALKSCNVPVFGATDARLKCFYEIFLQVSTLCVSAKLSSSHHQHAVISHCLLCLSVTVTPGYFFCRGIYSFLSVLHTSSSVRPALTSAVLHVSMLGVGGKGHPALRCGVR